MMQEDLETRLADEAEITSASNKEKSTLAGRFKNFMASTTAGWVFYTPIMAPIELFLADMESTEVITTRLLAGFGHLIGLPPYQKVREILGRRCKITEESSKLAKRAIDAVSFIPTHPPTYGLMLALAGTSLDEAAYALPAGLGIVMGTSPVFSPFMEKWRTKVFGMEPTYKKSAVKTE